MRDTASRPPLATHRNLAASTPLIPLQSSIHRDLEMQLAKKIACRFAAARKKGGGGEEARPGSRAGGGEPDADATTIQATDHNGQLGYTLIGPLELYVMAKKMFVDWLVK